MAKPIFDWDENFDAYLSGLSKKDEAKMLALIRRVEAEDLVISIRKERVKKLTNDIYELRAYTNEHWLRGCYFQVKDNKYFITHGFNKKTNKTPQREIKRSEKQRKLKIDHLRGE